MTQFNNNGVQSLGRRDVLGALNGIAGPSSDDPTVHGDSATYSSAAATGPLHGSVIGNGDGAQGDQAQKDVANHKTGFATRLASFGWSVAVLPVSLFNAVTSNLIALGNATVDTLRSILPEKRTENSGETRANTTHAAKARRPPNGVHSTALNDYKNLVRLAKASGLELSEPLAIPGNSPERTRITDLVNFAKKINAEADKKAAALLDSPADSQLPTYRSLQNKAAAFIRDYEKVVL